MAPSNNILSSYIVGGILRILGLDNGLSGVMTNELATIISNINNGIYNISSANIGNIAAITLIIITTLLGRHRDTIQQLLYKLWDSGLVSSWKHITRSQQTKAITNVKPNYHILEITESYKITNILKYFEDIGMLKRCTYVLDNGNYQFPPNMEHVIYDTYNNTQIDGYFILDKSQPNDKMIIGIHDNSLESINMLDYITDIYNQTIEKYKKRGVVQLKTYRQKSRDFMNVYQMVELKDMTTNMLENTYINSFFHPYRDLLWRHIKTLHFNPEKLYEYGQVPKIGLLLYGPPGTGKSSFAYRLACVLRREIVTLNLANYETYHALFTDLSTPSRYIKDKSPRDVIYMFDEFDQYITQIIENNNHDQDNKIMTNMTDKLYYDAISKCSDIIRKSYICYYKEYKDSGAYTSSLRKEPNKLRELTDNEVSNIATMIVDYNLKHYTSTTYDIIVPTYIIERVLDMCNDTILTQQQDTDAIDLIKLMGLYSGFDSKYAHRKVVWSHMYGSDKMRGFEGEIATISKINKQNAPRKILTLEELQEIFEGPIPIDGAIIIATTNKYDELMKVCPALLRPGRLTPYYFGNLINKSFTQLVNYYYDRDPDIDIDQLMKQYKCEIMPSHAIVIAMQINFLYDTDKTIKYNHFKQHILNYFESGGQINIAMPDIS